MNKDLIKKIKELKSIEPSQEWLDSTRNNLISEFDSEVSFFQWFKQPQQFALAFCLTLIVLAGPWLSIEASKASLPGELLYSVKKMTESVQITVTSDNSRAQLSVEFAGRRLEELNKMSENEQDNDRIKEIASQIKNNLEEASVYADRISKANMIAVVKKANEIKDELGENKENMSSEEQIELIEVENAVNEINRQVLATLIKNQELEDISASSTDQTVFTFLKELEDGSVTTTEEVINGE